MQKEFGSDRPPGGSDLDRVIFSNRPGEMSRVGFTESNLS